MRKNQLRRFGLVTTAVVAALVLSSCTPSPEEAAPSGLIETPFPAETQAQLEAAVTNAMTATGSSGAIVGVWAPWSGSWVAGLGTVSPTDTTPVTPDMSFRAGRITRSMSCDVLYGMVRDGIVNLDDAPSDYVPSIPSIDNITLAQLCDDTSGLGNYNRRLRSGTLNNPERVWNQRELISYGIGMRSNTPPGEGWSDSDAGYQLLALSLELASDKKMPELYEEYVFKPLGMQNSALATPGTTSGAPTVLNSGHTIADEDKVMQCQNPIDLDKLDVSYGWANAGISSTIEDLGRYGQALGKGLNAPEEVITVTSRYENPSPMVSTLPSWLRYKGGNFLAGSLIGQYDASPGYLTALFTDPNTGLIVSFALNNSAAGSGIAGALAWELAAIASKAPTTDGGAAPEGGLPWTAEQYHEEITAKAICP